MSRPIRSAVQSVDVVPEFFEEHGFTAIDLPPIHWFIEGPRGGIYEATGLRTRQVYDRSTDAEWFYRAPNGMLTIIDRSEDTRYIRPGTKRHTEAKAALR